MTGLEILRNPDTTTEQIVDIIAEHCPPVVLEHCDQISCRACWLAWLTAGEAPKKEGPSDKQTAPGGEAVDELSRAETALEQAVKIIQGAIAGEEQRKMLSDLSTLGRLLEKEQSTPTATELEKIEYLARGLIAGSIHLVAMPMESSMVSAEFIDTVRRKLAARLIFERRFGGYYIKFVELLPL